MYHAVQVWQAELDPSGERPNRLFTLLMALSWSTRSVVTTLESQVSRRSHMHNIHAHATCHMHMHTCTCNAHDMHMHICACACDICICMQHAHVCACACAWVPHGRPLVGRTVTCEYQDAEMPMHMHLYGLPSGHQQLLLVFQHAHGTCTRKCHVRVHVHVHICSMCVCACHVRCA